MSKSPSKKQTPALQNQIIPSTVIGVANSFDALVNEGDETQSFGGKTRVTCNVIQQKNAKDLAARLGTAIDKYHLDEQSQVPDDPTTTMHISNTELDKMVENAHAAMMINTTPKLG